MINYRRGTLGCLLMIRLLSFRWLKPRFTVNQRVLRIRSNFASNDTSHWRWTSDRREFIEMPLAVSWLSHWVEQENLVSSNFEISDHQQLRLRAERRARQNWPMPRQLAVKSALMCLQRRRRSGSALPKLPRMAVGLVTPRLDKYYFITSLCPPFDNFRIN